MTREHLMRIATFNLENFDDQAGQEPSLAARAAIMRPQLQRIAADVLCLQEVHSQPGAQGRILAAPRQLAGPHQI
jgi:exonuclease III